MFALYFRRYDGDELWVFMASINDRNYYDPIYSFIYWMSMEKWLFDMHGAIIAHWFFLEEKNSNRFRDPMVLICTKLPRSIDWNEHCHLSSYQPMIYVYQTILSTVINHCYCFGFLLCLSSFPKAFAWNSMNVCSIHKYMSIV